MDKNYQQEFQPGFQLLEKSEQYLKTPDTVNKGMDLLFNGLSEIRKEWQLEKWKYFCNNIVCHIQSVHWFIKIRSLIEPSPNQGDMLVMLFCWIIYIKTLQQ